MRARIGGHYRVADSADAEARAQSAPSARWRAVDRPRGYLEQLQVPIADARDATGVDGLTSQAARNFATSTG
ncbi:MAG: hypothetical protein R3F59_14290 [Myxococcota bacterium]